MKNRIFRINTILPILLFCLFALLALWVASGSVGAYRSQQAKLQDNYSSRIVSAYVGEKVRQAEPGSVSIGSVGDSQALVIGQDGGRWSTYIYRYDGKLMEQYTEAGAAVDPRGGTEIADAGTFRLEMVSDSLLKITYSTGSGGTEAAYMNLYS